ncbi:MAG: hypothetical protein KKA07_18735 [Bacteroidetes bacterium]|nr:hypothetical protein [Bacteroidota bacterium]MBU1721109.1 hypothetical protein [Bacteroidota bacterium]
MLREKKLTNLLLAAKCFVVMVLVSGTGNNGYAQTGEDVEQSFYLNEDFSIRVLTMPAGWYADETVVEEDEGEMLYANFFDSTGTQQLSIRVGPLHGYNRLELGETGLKIDGEDASLQKNQKADWATGLDMLTFESFAAERIVTVYIKPANTTWLEENFVFIRQ